MSVEFKDNRVKVKEAISEKITATLEECAGELESQVKRNTRVDSGQTKNSWQHRVEEDTAYIGSTSENSIWEEFGTGEYALKGNGRKGGWKYKDAKGKWHYTIGKKPSRALWRAFTTLKSKIKTRIENALKELG